MPIETRDWDASREMRCEMIGKPLESCRERRVTLCSPRTILETRLLRLRMVVPIDWYASACGDIGRAEGEKRDFFCSA